MAIFKKKKDVAAQPRDRFGRWVAKGANIKWRADGRNKVGIVKSALDGVATIEEKNGDGTMTGTTVQVPLEKLQVLTSKATIPSGAGEFEGKSDDLQSSLDDQKFKDELASEGTKMIVTPSGYKLEVKDDDDSGPLTYQLYAPSGKSLGIFAKEALEALQEMIDAGEDITDEVVAEVAGKPNTAAPSVPAAPAAGFATDTPEPKNFRVPPKVREKIKSVIDSADFAADDLTHAKALAYDSTVSMSDIKWIGNYFSEIDAAEKLRGGFDGRKWASKILDPQTPEEQFAPLSTGVTQDRYDFDEETFDFFAVGSDEESMEAFALIAVDYETGAVYIWKEEGFEYDEAVTVENFEQPSITPIDADTAVELAKYIDSNADGALDLGEVDEEERNLFLAAEAELDTEELDRVYTVLADATGYTPMERSQNAQKQKRGPGGKFGGGQATGAAPAGKLTAQFPKAKLGMDLPLVADISARIEEWLAMAEEAPEGALVASAEFAEEVPAEAPAEAPADEPATEAQAAALYFAIVDEVDKTAVMNAFAIVKQGGGPKAYLRENAKWAESPDVLADVQGPTPPPVVELDAPEPVTTVVAQIDQHDSTQTQETTDAEGGPAVVTASAEAVRGYSLPDGSFGIFSVTDLSKAVKDAKDLTDLQQIAVVRHHIRKRARAFNRMDIVPTEWRMPSVQEYGEFVASQSTHYDQFGSLTAAGRHHGGGAAELKRYWTRGKGALKIRWGTKGDLTRAHRHLAKYVGPERAWGLAQNYHKSLFGMSNYKRDN